MAQKIFTWEVSIGGRPCGSGNECVNETIAIYPFKNEEGVSACSGWMSMRDPELFVDILCWVFYNSEESELCFCIDQTWNRYIVSRLNPANGEFQKLEEGNYSLLKPTTLKFVFTELKFAGMEFQVELIPGTE